MAWGSHAERRAAVLKLAEKAEARAIEHRAREASSKALGKDEKAKGHAATAKRQERIAQTHRQELVRLQMRAQLQAYQGVTAAERAHEMERAKERAEAAAAARPAIDALQAYREALTTAASLEEDAKRFDKHARGYSRVGDDKKQEIALDNAALMRRRAIEWRSEAERIQSGTSRDLARELQIAIKATQRGEAKARKEERRLADIGIDAGLATAAAQREIASGGRKRGGTAIASLSDYANLIRKPQERTQGRLQAMEHFDNLCGTADAGLFPEPRFEHESGSGKGPGALVLARRAEGLEEMAAIKAAIGASNVEMLRAWIYERQTLTALVRAGYATEKSIGKLTLAAVDALQVYLTTRDALSAVMAGMGLRWQPPPSESASVDPESPQSQECESETSNFAVAPASHSQPETPPPSSSRPPANATRERATISCPEPISDDARRTIQRLTASRARA